MHRLVVACFILAVLAAFGSNAAMAGNHEGTEQVQLQVRFLELNRNVSRALGVDYEVLRGNRFGINPID
ncbi:MAG: hypothetical protein R3362_12450, partial [Rhodothermales bacterium]|nr:hypothetical protein [Rhodothermales bacterium]